MQKWQRMLVISSMHRYVFVRVLADRNFASFLELDVEFVDRLINMVSLFC